MTGPEPGVLETECAPEEKRPRIANAPRTPKTAATSGNAARRSAKNLQRHRPRPMTMAMTALQAGAHDRDDGAREPGRAMPSSSSASGEETTAPGGDAASQRLPRHQVSPADNLRRRRATLEEAIAASTRIAGAGALNIATKYRRFWNHRGSGVGFCTERPRSRVKQSGASLRAFLASDRKGLSLLLGAGAGAGAGAGSSGWGSEARSMALAAIAAEEVRRVRRAVRDESSLRWPPLSFCVTA